MTYILIKHHMFNTYLMGPGGSEYVTLETAIAFTERGFPVYIDSVTLNTPSKLRELADHYGLKRPELRLIGIGDPAGDPLLTINTSGDILSGHSDVLYLHYPSFLNYDIYYPGLNGIFNLVGKTYSLLNSVIFPFMMKKIKIYIANSSFTALFFKKYYNIDPYVITPPVNIDDIVSEPLLIRNEREYIVLSVSRISPEKHVENILYVARKFSREKNKPRFVIAGSLSKYNRDYYDELREKAFKEGIDDIVEFKVNISRTELVDLYRKAMVYMHPTPREHFGISIVEAMAAGTPVVIPIDSGSWVDIALGNSNIAAPYGNINEAFIQVKTLLENERLWVHLSKRSINRARELDRHVFHDKLYYALEPLILKRWGGTANLRK
ncbi:MAG: glycosyltransferase [Desulfurococcus sp.]|uniref:glycosyltransferase n=2 Tax=Desulfurococcus sp. TaxID=51678 RepID=UPI00315FA89C